MNDTSWWVFLQDTNGSRRFVGAPYNFASKQAAEARVTEIESGQSKKHKIEYWVVHYEGTEVDPKAAYSITG